MNYFKLYEFFPKCVSEEINEVLRSPYMSNNLYVLFGVANAIRELAGCPLVVTSGYRSKSHNERVGGSKTSQHMQMEALDCHLVGKDIPFLLSAIRKYAKENPGILGQVIVYGSSFIHIALSNANHPDIDVIYKTY